METVASEAEGIRGQAHRLFLKKDVGLEVSGISWGCGSGGLLRTLVRNGAEPWEPLPSLCSLNHSMDVKPGIDRHIEWGKW